MKRSAGLYRQSLKEIDPIHMAAGALCMEEPGFTENMPLAVDDQRVATFIETSEKYRTRLLSVARRIAPTAEDAEDMVQDALLKAYRSLSQFRNDSRMETWLYKITQNAAHDYLRRQKHRNDISLDQTWNDEEARPALNIPDTAMGPEEYCGLREMQAMLIEALAKLGPKCKQAIVLCILEDMPQRVAAKRLRIRPATVKARIFHGKQMLKGSIRALAQSKVR